MQKAYLLLVKLWTTVHQSQVCVLWWAWVSCTWVLTYVSVCHLVCLQLCSSVWIYAEEIADLHGWTGEVRVYRFTKTFAPNCFLISPRTQFLIPQLKIVPSKAPLESDHIINTHTKQAKVLRVNCPGTTSIPVHRPKHTFGLKNSTLPMLAFKKNLTYPTQNNQNCMSPVSESSIPPPPIKLYKYRFSHSLSYVHKPTLYHFS